MMFLIVGLLLAIAGAEMFPGTKTCVTIRNRNYEEEVLKNYVKSPYQLVIDYDTNTLFFSYTARTDEMFKISYLSLKTGETGVVNGIHGGFANAVNNRSHNVYMGGEDGIYKFDYETKTARNLHVKDDANIWQMFYKDGLYFTTYPEEKAFLYKSRKVVEVPELKDTRVMIIAVNNDNNIVYSNTSGLFMYNKTNGNAIYLDDSVLNGITTDINGNLYFSTPSGIYYINEKTKSVDELFQMENIYGVAIESNENIIYATEDSIVRLKPTKKVCLEEAESNKRQD